MFNPISNILGACKGGLKAVLHGTICMMQFVWFDLSEGVDSEIVPIFCIKISMIQFLKERMSFISLELYEEILKPNKSHTNRIIQIVPCKTAFTRNNLHDSFGFKISSYKSEEVELILSFKNRIIQKCRKLLRFCNLHVQISRIIQIISYKSFRVRPP